MLSVTVCEQVLLLGLRFNVRISTRIKIRFHVIEPTAKQQNVNIHRSNLRAEYTYTAKT